MGSLQCGIPVSYTHLYEDNGLLAVLCDGMGGMTEGGMIASQTAAELMRTFPWEEDDAVVSWISRRSAKVDVYKRQDLW